METKYYYYADNALRRFRRTLNVKYNDISLHTGFSVYKIQGKEKCAYLPINELLEICNKMHWMMCNVVSTTQDPPDAQKFSEDNDWKDITFDANAFSRDVIKQETSITNICERLNLAYRGYKLRFAPDDNKPHFLSLEYIVNVCNIYHLNLSNYLIDPNKPIESIFYKEGLEYAHAVEINTLAQTVAQMDKEIKLLHQQLAEANKEKMRANFLRAISHDLRTPVTSIINLLSDLEENEDYSPEERKKIIHNIYDDADWLLNMGDNLLSITRMQGTDSKLKTSPELVEEVISESVIRFKKRFPAAQVEISIPDEILLIPMDATLIEQVLMNLLENALVHSQSQKPIKLFVENQPHTVCFHVIDYGIGINPEYLDTIFDGICGSGPSDVRNRMGVGLSICKTIITAHNGTIIARNHEHGAEFVFTLPKEEPNDKI